MPVVIVVIAFFVWFFIETNNTEKRLASEPYKAELKRCLDINPPLTLKACEQAAWDKSKES